MVTSLSPQERESQAAHIRDDRRGELVGVYVTLLVLASLSVIVRFWGRRLQGAQWRADDYTMMLAVIFSYSLCVLVFVAMRFGLGRHALAVGPKNISKFLLIVWLYELVYVITNPLIKLAILLFYRRVFQTRPIKIAVYAVASFIILWSMSRWTLDFFQCRPVHRFWDRSIPGTCINSKTAFIISSSLNITTDLIILVLPIPTIWKLQLPTAQKWALSGVFLVGGFVCVASIVRATYLPNLITHDPTWSAVGGAVWSSVELLIGLVTANLPLMFPVYLKVIRPRLKNIFTILKTAKITRGSGSPSQQQNDESWLSKDSRISWAPGTLRRNEGIVMQPSQGFVRLDEARIINTVETDHNHAGAENGKEGEPGLPLNVISVSTAMHWSDTRTD